MRPIALPYKLLLVSVSRLRKNPFSTTSLQWPGHHGGKTKTLHQDAQKAQTSHPPNPGAPRRALSQARPQRTFTFYKGWLGLSQLRASNEGLLKPRVARARGSS